MSYFPLTFVTVRVWWACVQYIPRNMHTVFALLCFVAVIHWLIFPYPSGLLHWHCGNLTIAPVPAKQPWWIWINTSCEFIMNDCITRTKQSTTKPCAYFLGYTVRWVNPLVLGDADTRQFRNGSDNDFHLFVTKALPKTILIHCLQNICKMVGGHLFSVSMRWLFALTSGRFSP